MNFHTGDAGYHFRPGTMPNPINNIQNFWNTEDLMSSEISSKPFFVNDYETDMFGLGFRENRAFDKQSPSLNFSDIHVDETIFENVSKNYTSMDQMKIANCDGEWRPMRNVPVQNFFMRHKKLNDDQEWINDEKTFAFVLYEKIKLLSNKAEKEDWGYQLHYLSQHLDHTFRRAAELCNDLDTIMGYYPDESDEPTHCCFHTGLITPNIEFLYALLTLNVKQSSANPKWFLYTFQTANTMVNSHKMRMYHQISPFEEFALPKKVTYWKNNPNELFYSTSIRIEDVDIAHLISNDHDQEKKKKLMSQYKSLIEFQTRLSIGLLKAKIKIEVEPRVVIPQYFRHPDGQGEIQLLVPIILEHNGSHSDYAIVLKLEDSGRETYYRVLTLLHKDQCYINARLIQRIDNTWLSPPTFKNKYFIERRPFSEPLIMNSSKGFDNLVSILRQFATQNEKPPELAQIAGQLKQAVPSLSKGKGHCKRYIKKASEAGVVKLIEKGKQIYIILEE